MTLFLCLQCGFLVEFWIISKAKQRKHGKGNTVSQVISYSIHQGQTV